MKSLKSFNAIFLRSSFLPFFYKYIVYLIGLSLMLSGIVFILGGSVKNSLPIFLSICVLTVLLTGWEFFQFYKLKILRIVIFLLITNAIIGVSTIVVTNLYDKSWDGMAYHQIAIMKLVEGWNPVYKSLPLEELKSKHFENNIVLNRYVNHYPKAHEIFSAVWIGITNRIESGKVFNVLVILAAFSSVYFLLLGFQKISAPWCLLLALTAALNPIALSQLFSYYIDGAIASLLVIFIVQLIQLYRDDKNKISQTSLFIIFFLIIIISNMKFTALVYTVLFCLLFAVFLLKRKRIVLFKKFLLVAISAGILAVGVIGFNPYVTNTRDYGHPFYPVAGAHKEDIISLHTPVEFLKLNSLEKFINSTFSESASFDRRVTGRHIKWKIPFTFKIAEIKALQGEGIRLGGFGIFWSGILLTSLVLLGIAVFSLEGKARFYVLVLVSAVALTVAINPEAWWCRFVPQLWLIPVIIYAFLICCGKPYVVNIAKSMVIIVLINGIIVAIVAFSSTIKTTIKTNNQFSKWAKSEKPILVYFDMFFPNERKLKERSIPFIKVNSLKELPCNNPTEVFRIEFCN